VLLHIHLLPRRWRPTNATACWCARRAAEYL